MRIKNIYSMLSYTHLNCLLDYVCYCFVLYDARTKYLPKRFEHIQYLLHKLEFETRKLKCHGIETLHAHEFRELPACVNKARQYSNSEGTFSVCGFRRVFLSCLC